MNILWLNLRKRGRNRQVIAVVEAIVQELNIDILLLQEAFAKTAGHIEILMMKQVHTNLDLCVFVKGANLVEEIIAHENFAVGIKYMKTWMWNIHLSPYKADTRIKEIVILGNLIRAMENREVIIGGDFNLAPRQQDGLIDGRYSTWTKPGERLVYNSFVSTNGFVDLLDGPYQEFSVERRTKIGEVQFRCDLALCASQISDRCKARYVHSTRVGSRAFTDHSGIHVSLNYE